MKRRSTVAAIDVGSTKVAVIVGDTGDNGEARILGIGVAPATGLRSVTPMMRPTSSTVCAMPSACASERRPATYVRTADPREDSEGTPRLL